MVQCDNQPQKSAVRSGVLNLARLRHDTNGSCTHYRIWVLRPDPGFESDQSITIFRAALIVTIIFSHTANRDGPPSQQAGLRAARVAHEDHIGPARGRLCLERHRLPAAAADLVFGRIVASEAEAPNMLVGMV